MTSSSAGRRGAFRRSAELDRKRRLGPLCRWLRLEQLEAWRLSSDVISNERLSLDQRASLDVGIDDTHSQPFPSTPAYTCIPRTNDFHVGQFVADFREGMVATDRTTST